MANPVLAPLLGFLGRLSYPRLFMITAALFVADLIVPDFIPLARAQIPPDCISSVLVICFARTMNRFGAEPT